MCLALVVELCLPVAGCTPELKAVRAIQRNHGALYWGSQQIEIQVAPPPELALKQLEIVRLCRAAVRAWGVEARVSVTSSQASRAISEDGINTLALTVGMPATSGIGREETALTTLYARPNDRLDRATILEADIAIPAPLIDWQQHNSRAQFQALFSHELGHFLGLDHACGELDSTTRVGRERPRCSKIEANADSIMLPDPLLRHPLRLEPSDAEIREARASFADQSAANEPAPERPR